MIYNNFDKYDPSHPETRNQQYVPINGDAWQIWHLAGFGRVPFDWLDELAKPERGKAHTFSTKIYWAKQIDLSQHTENTLYDVNFSLPGDPHVQDVIK